MTIKEIIQNKQGRAGHMGAWIVSPSISGRKAYALWHYGTRMLVWQEDESGNHVEDWSTGHGSVSDQNGMNIAFKALNIPAYFSRKGGAAIIVNSANIS